MLYLIITKRSRQIVTVMGHDVKQFKALEGFLESGPQFVLQSYILLNGGGSEDDLGFKEEACKRSCPSSTYYSLFSVRTLTLIVSVTLSFFSLAKTGFNVNLPDPDEARKSKQHPENASKFKLTSALFHLLVTLFRVSSLTLFFACFQGWTVVVLAFCAAVNLLLFYFSQASFTMCVLLSAVSIFMPNG